MATATEGRSEVVKQIGAGLSGDKFGAVAIATGSQAVGDTSSRLANTLDSHAPGVVSANGNTLTLVGTFTGNSDAVHATSVYNNTNSTLLAKQLMNTVNVQTNDTLEITWNINVS